MLAGVLNNLGGRLSELGRREEALAAAREAVEVYRGLAKARPDALGPDLGVSLGTLGTVLLEAGRAVEARSAFEEGVGALRTQFARLPTAYGALMAGLFGDYLEGCRRTGEEPDATPGSGIVERMEGLRHTSC